MTRKTFCDFCFEEIKGLHRLVDVVIESLGNVSSSNMEPKPMVVKELHVHSHCFKEKLDPLFYLDQIALNKQSRIKSIRICIGD